MHPPPTATGVKLLVQPVEVGLEVLHAVEQCWQVAKSRAPRRTTLVIRHPIGDMCRGVSPLRRQNRQAYVRERRESAKFAPECFHASNKHLRHSTRRLNRREQARETRKRLEDATITKLPPLACTPVPDAINRPSSVNMHSPPFGPSSSESITSLTAMRSIISTAARYGRDSFAGSRLTMLAGLRGERPHASLVSTVSPEAHGRGLENTLKTSRTLTTPLNPSPLDVLQELGQPSAQRRLARPRRTDH